MGLRSKKGAQISPSRLANYIARRREGARGPVFFFTGEISPKSEIKIKTGN
jgi:hypothetical protein